MKLFGHPVHPLMIHFPTALLPMDLVMTCLFYSTGNTSFYTAGFYALAGGAAIGLLAMVTGLVDLLGIPKESKKAIASALYHGFLNGSIIIIFSIIAYKAWLVFPAPYMAGTTGMIIKLLLVISLLVGNYLGGRLIYQYFIGIELKNERNGKITA